jgi:uncharacterized lipoprotein
MRSISLSSFRWTLVAGAAAAVCLTGCSGDRALSCADSQRYADSGSIAPWSVPNDLSLPDESDALQIPNVSEDEDSGRTGCLETPPRYYDEDQQNDDEGEQNDDD